MFRKLITLYMIDNMRFLFRRIVSSGNRQPTVKYQVWIYRCNSSYLLHNLAVWAAPLDLHFDLKVVR